jgi:peptidoglycan/xylan/chitin deacetylase (PgdA/CDA1 family)
MTYKSKKFDLYGSLSRIVFPLVKYSLIILLSISGINVHAQGLTLDNSNFFYQISPIFDFKKGIVSLTFDDGYLSQFKTALPLLKKRNLPATFYVITGNIDSTTKSLILKNVSYDYEIGSHSVTHPDLSKISTAEVTAELIDSKTYLKKYFGVNSGLTMSYPYGEYNDSIVQIVKSMYLAARSTDPGYNSFNSDNRFVLRAYGFDDKTGINIANSRINFAIQNHLWLIEMIHAINNGTYISLDSTTLSEHLDYIENAEQDIWCSNVGNVIKYFDESSKAQVECDLCNDTIYKFRLNDYLDDLTYNQPLSLRIKVPDNWDSISVSGINKFKNEYNNNSKFILFNALPDNNEITIRPVSLTMPIPEKGLRVIYLSSNPFIDKIQVSLEVLIKQDLDIILSDMNGKLISHQNKKNVFDVMNLNFDTSGISKGFYFLRVNGSTGERIVKKLVKISFQ